METKGIIRAMSKSELADAYHISLKAFRIWLEPFMEQVGEYRGKTFTPKQVKIIFDLFGIPQ